MSSSLRGDESMSPPTSPVVPSASASAETPRASNTRSLSRASSVSEVPQHHHYGTSYFTNVSVSTARPSSPPSNVRRSTYRPTPRRTLSGGSTTRAQRTPSMARRDESITVDEEDEAGEEDDEITELRARARAEEEGEEEDGEEDGEVDPITLRQRQSLINVEHPFGLPIWKPALYKKSRSVTRHADEALHSIPSAQAEKHLLPGNIAWTVLFGWWLALVCLFVAGLLFLVPRGGRRYARLVFGLSWYLLWPFGKFVEGNLEKSYPEDEEAPMSPSERPISISVTDESSHPTINARRQALNHTHSVSWVPPLTPGERTSLLSNGNSHTVLIAPVKSYGATSSSSYDERVDLKDARAADRVGKLVYWLLLTTLIAPLMLAVCLVCWSLVITIPMAKLNWALLQYMFGRADSIRFCAAPPILLVPQTDEDADAEADGDDVNGNGAVPRPLKITPPIAAGQVAPPSSAPTSTVLLCTYKAVGWKYYKYTVGGVNIFFINLLPVVFLVIFDHQVLLPLAEHKEHAGEPVNPLLAFVTAPALLFAMSLLSVIPLSYFLGMAVASISAQSSIGMGAVINATFGSIIEIILYGIALTQGKGRLVEGSIIGSLLAGVLLMPGMSMVSGATKKKEMKFNAQSASVTSTMLIMAIIGTLAPTLFYQTYGSFQLVCDGCSTPGTNGSITHPGGCDRCYYRHPDPTDDVFFQTTVKSLMYLCATILLLSYLIGLWFSLRTHASHIWQKPRQHDIPVPNRMSLYQPPVDLHRPATLPHSLRRKTSNITAGSDAHSRSATPTPHAREPVPQGQAAVPSTPGLGKRVSYANLPTSSAQAYAPILETVNTAVENSGLAPPANMTQADFTRAVTIATVSALRHQHVGHSPAPARLSGGAVGEVDDGAGHGGHDAPSWSRGMSASVLLGCTFLYAIIAEILVDVVDVVLEGSGLDEKFLGVTLFALVPNTTEFMNAMAFAMGGNIALSMEIGSAYALQVCLLQIPAMVAFSAWYTGDKLATAANTFNLIFPRWDVIAIILSVFLMTYTYIEAKSNYHRGSILILSYCVLVAGFYYAPHRSDELEEVPQIVNSAAPLSIPQSVQFVYNTLFSR